MRTRWPRLLTFLADCSPHCASIVCVFLFRRRDSTHRERGKCARCALGVRRVKVGWNICWETMLHKDAGEVITKADRNFGLQWLAGNVAVGWREVPVLPCRGVSAMSTVFWMPPWGYLRIIICWDWSESSLRGDASRRNRNWYSSPNDWEENVLHLLYLRHGMLLWDWKRVVFRGLDGTSAFCRHHCPIRFFLVMIGSGKSCLDLRHR